MFGGDIAEIERTGVGHARTHRARCISTTNYIVVVDVHFRCGRCGGCGAHRKIRQVRLMIREADMRMIGRQRCDRRHRCDRCITADLRQIRQRRMIVMTVRRCGRVVMMHVQMTIGILIMLHCCRRLYRTYL